MNILVTAGATREPLDAVRFLSNVSTGSTGAALADAFAARNHCVTLLHGESAVTPRSACAVEVFTSAEDLRTRLQRHLAGGTFDAAIMAPPWPTTDQILPLTAKSHPTRPSLRCASCAIRKSPQLKSFSPRPLVVIGFKLTIGADAVARRVAVAASLPRAPWTPWCTTTLKRFGRRRSIRSALPVGHRRTRADRGCRGTRATLDRLVATNVSEWTKAKSPSR